MSTSRLLVYPRAAGSLACCLVLWFGCTPVHAQKDLLYEETIVARQTQFRNQIDAGILYSGAEPRDLDDGVFGWNYVTYAAYRFKVDNNDLLRFRHQYWDYLEPDASVPALSNAVPSRNVFEASWRHGFSGASAMTATIAVLDEEGDYQLGTAYFAWQGALGRDGIWFLQGGAGMDSEDEYHGDVYMEVVKPVTVSTILRFRNETFGCTDDSINNTFRLNVVQGLSRRFAVNAGYRLYYMHPGDSDVEDLTSHEGSADLVYQALDNLFFGVRYRYYWNTENGDVNSVSFEGRWNPIQRLALVAGHQLQFLQNGVARNGFRGGFSLSF